MTAQDAREIKIGDKVICYGMECEVIGIFNYANPPLPYFQLRITSRDNSKKNIPVGKVREVEKNPLAFHLIGLVENLGVTQ